MAISQLELEFILQYGGVFNNPLLGTGSGNSGSGTSGGTTGNSTSGDGGGDAAQEPPFEIIKTNERTYYIDKDGHVWTPRDGEYGQLILVPGIPANEGFTDTGSDWIIVPPSSGSGKILEGPYGGVEASTGDPWPGGPIQNHTWDEAPWWRPGDWPLDVWSVGVPDKAWDSSHIPFFMIEPMDPNEPFPFPGDWDWKNNGSEPNHSGENSDGVRTGMMIVPIRSGLSVGIKTTLGTSGDDRIVGQGMLLGDAGNDVISGSASADVINGGIGNDVLSGGAGADTLNGGDGVDTLVYGDAEGALVDLRTGYTAGQAAGDVISNIENVVGGAGHDTVYGSDDANELNGQGGNDILAGADGNDTLWGGNGNDWLEGGSGDDLLAGGAGDDRLVGGAGNDALHGEAGRDVFVFESALNAATNVDWIADFSVAEDWIGLSRSVFGGFGASVALAVGAGATAATAQVVYDSATGALSYDADGTGGLAQVKFAQLSAGLALSAANFVLI